MFRELIGGAETPPFVRLSPEEQEKNRRAIGKRYARARAVLAADFWIHSVVDGALILGHEAKLLIRRAPAYPRSCNAAQSPLQKGLEALAQHFGYDKGDRRQGPPAAPSEAAATTRTRRPGLEVVFHPQGAEGRPDPADVTEAVASLRVRAKPPL